MKISRIIRSITEVLVIVLICILLLVTVRNITLVKNNPDLHIKTVCCIGYIFAVFLYIVVIKKLYNKLINNKLITIYVYLYLGVLVFISRFLTVQYFEKELVMPGTMYQIIFSTIITYINVIFIKLIIYNISKSDILSIITSITYVFMPQGITASVTYSKYNLNLAFILMGIYLLLKIIDSILDKNQQDNKYIVFALSHACIIIADIINGNSYICFLTIVIYFYLIIEYSDIIYLKPFVAIKEKTRLNSGIDYKHKNIQISKKLVVLSIYLFAIFISLIIIKFENMNVLKTFEFIKSSLVNLIANARYFYLIIFTIIIIFDFTSIILERKQEIKYSIINFTTIVITLFTVFVYKGELNNIVFEGIILIKFILSLANIYLNRDEKIKMLKEKN